MNTLYENAMNKLKTDKSMFTQKDIIIYLNYYNNYNEMIRDGITTQISKDIQIYKKYDAIAWWVGVGGLIECEPEFIIGLVKLFGIEE